MTVFNLYKFRLHPKQGLMQEQDYLVEALQDP